MFVLRYAVRASRLVKTFSLVIASIVIASILPGTIGWAQIDVKLVDRTVDGATLQWSTAAKDIDGFSIMVLDLTTGTVVVPPMELRQTSLRLPLDGIPTSVLRSESRYEATIRPLPDGVPVKMVIPPFVTVPAGPPVEASEIETLLAESDMDATKRYSLNDKMRAQADLLHGISGWNRSLSEHRIELAVAVDLELDNWKKKVAIYFDRREENLRGKMRVLDRYEQMSDQRLRIRQNAIRRRLETTLQQPKYAGKVDSTLNFLLSLFPGTPIGYGMGLDDYFASHPSHSRWDVSQPMLESLRVKTPNHGGGQIEFRLSDPRPLEFDWWPPVMREPVFAPALAELEFKRDQLIALSEQDPQLPMEAIAELEVAFAQLMQVFVGTFGSNWSGRPSGQIRELIRTEDHLAQINREIKAIRDRGTIDAMGQGQYFNRLEDGKNAATLVAWMIRNGMEFAPPRPGAENHYNELLSDLKELIVIFGDPVPDTFEPLPETDQPRVLSPPSRDP